MLEYAIAYWLTRASAQSQRDQLIEQLGDPDATATHWLPVIRQYLTIVDSEAEFTAVVEQFDLNQMGLFGTVAYAAEAGQFANEGFQSVICGPGDIAQAHRADEFIHKAQLDEGVAFMHRLIERLS